MRRTPGLLAFTLFTLTLTLASRPATASFHSMSIVQVFPGTAAAPNARYVMLQMYFGGQTFVDGHQVIFYNAAGTMTGSATFSGNLLNGNSQDTVLIATTEAQMLFGVTPDLIMTAAHLIPSGGKVCFTTSNYDCFAWGNYTGSATGVGTPFNQGGGLTLGQAALRRLDIAGGATTLDSSDDTGDSANDFRLGTPSPRANSGAIAVDMTMGPPSDLTMGPVDLVAPPEDLTPPMPVDQAVTPADLSVEPADLSAEPADLAVTPADLTAPAADSAVTPPDLTQPPAVDMAETARTDPEGCGCRVAGRAPVHPFTFLALGLGALLVRRRRAGS